MNLGLYRGDNNMYLVFGVNNMTLCKKHLTGLTKVAEEVSQSFDGETFTEQINSIKSLIGEKVLLSKVREIIVDKDRKINHRKFDAFKNSLRFMNNKWTKQEYATLSTESEKLILIVKMILC